MSTLVGKSQIVVTGINTVTGALSPTNRTITNSFGNFVLNGATPVTVTDTSVAANSVIPLGLKTVGGTVGALPVVQTVTIGVGFTIAGTAGDTSTYNYRIEG